MMFLEELLRKNSKINEFFYGPEYGLLETNFLTDWTFAARFTMVIVAHVDFGLLLGNGVTTIKFAGGFGKHFISCMAVEP
jgi:hypothetical protein